MPAEIGPQEKTLATLCKGTASALSYADARMESLVGVLQSPDYDLLPSEVKKQLEAEVESLSHFAYVAVGAFEEGLLDYELALSLVAEEFGKRGAARLERLVEGYRSYWKRIRDSAPSSTWSPEKGLQMREEKQQRALDAVLTVVGKLTGLDSEEARNAHEFVKLIESLAPEIAKDCLGRAVGLLVAHGKKQFKEHPLEKYLSNDAVLATQLLEKLVKSADGSHFVRGD